MINSAEEFVRLRTSEQKEEYSKAVEDEAPISVWLDIVDRFPEMKEWVVHNRTVPLEIRVCKSANVRRADKEQDHDNISSVYAVDNRSTNHWC